MAIKRKELTQTLEDAIADVAMLLADEANRERRIEELRKHFLSIWEMAELGDPPEFELETRVVGLRDRIAS